MNEDSDPLQVGSDDQECQKPFRTDRDVRHSHNLEGGMVLETITEHKATHQSSQEKTAFWTKSTILSTIIVIIIGSALYLFTDIITMPYLIVGLVPLGIFPSYAVVATKLHSPSSHRRVGVKNRHKTRT
ncbi:MAG: hypothetical protein ACFFF9_17180 [Candidatus Thorarchaeota archaeon]